jgi:hypothetical protein
MSLPLYGVFNPGPYRPTAKEIVHSDKHISAYARHVYGDLTLLKKVGLINYPEQRDAIDSILLVECNKCRLELSCFSNGWLTRSIVEATLLDLCGLCENGRYC